MAWQSKAKEKVSPRAHSRARISEKKWAQTQALEWVHLMARKKELRSVPQRERVKVRG